MAGSSPLWLVVRFAVFTRVATLLLQLLLNRLIPDHDPDAFAPPPSPRANDSAFTAAVEWSLGGLTRWDAAYFLFVAEHGYAYEQSFAFFPLFPALVRILASAGVHGDYGGDSDPDIRGRLIVAATCLNMAAFAVAAAALYRLGAAVLRDDALALRAALLFCATPASVFMSAAYSESLFACLSFSAVLAHELRRPSGAVALFTLAAAARANGLALLGFPLHRALQRCADSCRWGRAIAAALPSVAWSLALTAASAAIIAVPFLAFQLYGRALFCRRDGGASDSSPLPEHLLLYARSRGYVVREAQWLGEEEEEGYCRSVWPLLYAHVQRRHWDVGFLRYYRVKQLPNFVLAAPMALLAGVAVWSYGRRNGRLCVRLGLVQDGAGREESVHVEQDTGLRSGYYSAAVFVYVAHLAVMLTFGLTCMHVQVLTRFLASSCPPVYWFAAHVTLRRHLESGSVSRPEASREEVTTDEHSSSSFSSVRPPLPPPYGIRSGTSVTGPPSTACRQRAVDRQLDAPLASNRAGRSRSDASAEPGPGRGSSDEPAGWVARLGGSALRVALRALPKNDVTRDLARWPALSAGAQLVYGYFLSYALLGVALHCNCFPWT